MPTLKQAIKKTLEFERFITRGIWSMRLDDVSKKKSFLFRFIRIILLAFRGFKEDFVGLRASALTYYSLMSIVPILAMGFGVAKGFGFDKYLERQIIENFKGQEEVLNQAISFANSLLERTGGGLIAGIGVVILFWSVMNVFSNIEISFNAIWQIDRGRSITRKFSDYLSLMLVAPVLMIAASSANVYLSTQLNSISQQIELIGYISPYIMFLFKLIPYVIIWLLFSVIYIVMPNTKVSIVAGIIAGIIAGSAFQVTQWFYIDFQIGVSKYNAIYGSFAALPLFLIWMRISWLIVLFGAELSFAYQNVQMYEFESETDNISHRSRRVLSILILNRIIKRFTAGEEPLTATELAIDLKLPVRMVRSLLNNLIKCRIVSETYTDDPKSRGFQPAQYIDKFTIAYVIDQLDNMGASLEPDTELMVRVKEIHDSFFKNVNNLPENILVKDL